MPEETPPAGTTDRPVLGGRRPAREQALLLLYEAEARSVGASTLLEDHEVDLDPFTAAALTGVEEHREEIDRLIVGRLTNWPLERLAATDRAALRLGVWELAHRGEIPAAVILNEAVELGRTYGSEESGAFVNGVLAALAAVLRPGETTRDPG